MQYKIFKMNNVKLDFRHKERDVFLRVFVFPGHRPFSWPPALALAPGPGSRLPALAPNLYLPALAPSLYLPALAPNLYLP